MDSPKPSGPQASPRPSLTPSYLPAFRQTSRVMTNVESPRPHLGWHSRGYVPHWDHPGTMQSLNFRLGDALPKAVLEKWKRELELPRLGAPAYRRIPRRRPRQMLAAPA